LAYERFVCGYHSSQWVCGRGFLDDKERLLTVSLNDFAAKDGTPVRAIQVRSVQRSFSHLAISLQSIATIKIAVT
jgi:hypothetical protein